VNPVAHGPLGVGVVVAQDPPHAGEGVLVEGAGPLVLTSSRRSPAGAEAMNTGIQDGVNLAWKLAVAVQGAAAGGLPRSGPQGEGELPPLGNDIVYANGPTWTAWRRD
jgi:hypothetical protein